MGISQNRWFINVYMCNYNEPSQSQMDDLGVPPNQRKAIKICETWSINWDSMVAMVIHPSVALGIRIEMERQRIDP